MENKLIYLLLSILVTDIWSKLEDIPTKYRDIVKYSIIVVVIYIFLQQFPNI